ncbi:MAG: hypothetical protein QME74_07265 [Candidatus Edwardsbacteria bacterium]|nr:hypothetical protein [Candidatus Edwardsbacteria bacterium]
MLGWVIVIVALAVFSLFQRLFPQAFPQIFNLGGDILLLLVSLGILVRMSLLQRKGKKETLLNRVTELEKRIAEMEQGTPNPT